MDGALCSKGMWLTVGFSGVGLEGLVLLPQGATEIKGYTFRLINSKSPKSFKVGYWGTKYSSPAYEVPKKDCVS